MTPRRQEKAPKPEKKVKKRFQIVKLEERIAPRHRHTSSGSSGGSNG